MQFVAVKVELPSFKTKKVMAALKYLQSEAALSTVQNTVQA